MVFSYRACSDEYSYDALPIELSRRIVIEAVLAEEETSTEPLPDIFYSVCSKRSVFNFLNKHEAMSHSSLGSCELYHRFIARDGTWIFVEAMLAEEETMGGADAFFSGRL
nr:hypothetical protein [Evansella caseinilytica]